MKKVAIPASIGVIGALVTGFVLLSARQAPAKDPDIRVLCSNGIKAAMEALIPEAERATGRTIVIQFSSSAVLRRSIDGGEPFDLAILTPGIVDDLIRAGKIQAGTHTDLASAALAVGVRAGAPKADVGTPEAMKRTLLAAKSITYTKEGAASAAIASMVRSLGSRTSSPPGRPSRQCQATPPRPSRRASTNWCSPPSAKSCRFTVSTFWACFPGNSRRLWS